MLNERERLVVYWKTKWEKAELEKDLLVTKDSEDVQTLRNREVWLNSFLEGCCISLDHVCRELKIERPAPDRSTAGYVSWIKGAATQLEGVGQRIDSALKGECRRASRYAGGLVLACIRDAYHRLDLRVLHDGFSGSRLSRAQIETSAQ